MSVLCISHYGDKLTNKRKEDTRWYDTIHNTGFKKDRIKSYCICALL